MVKSVLQYKIIVFVISALRLPIELQTRTGSIFIVNSQT